MNGILLQGKPGEPGLEGHPGREGPPGLAGARLRNVCSLITLLIFEFLQVYYVEWLTL